MRRKKRKAGSAAAVLLVGWLALGAVFAADKKPPLTAIVAGSVYRDTGFSLSGAEIAVTGVEKGKKKAWKTTSGTHGDFTVRVPAGPAEYNVIVKAGGFRTYEKSVTVGADERIELSIILEAEKEKR